MPRCRVMTTSVRSISDGSTLARRGGLRAVGADETSVWDFQSRSGDVFAMPKRPPTVVLETERLMLDHVEIVIRWPS